VTPAFHDGAVGSLRIGQLAKRTAMTVDGIRFYERRGLLPEAPRTSGHFRVYNTDDVKRVRFVRRMQTLGFSLTQIKQLMDLRQHKVEACEAVRDALQQQLSATRAKARQLRNLEIELMTDLRKCDGELKHRQRHTACACPVLEKVEK
jgi:MerR family transcriptional regulator, copper efflux regulator